MKFFRRALLHPLKSGLLMTCAVALTACAHAEPVAAADREALFEEIVAKTMTREAFSPFKNDRFGLSFPEAFEAHRDDFIAADTDEKLYWALVRLSNARHDRHLGVSAVEGGLAVPVTYNDFDPADYPDMQIDTAAAPVAPIRFLPDFSADPIVYFVADLGEDIAQIEGGERISIGDIVVSVNGASFADYLEAIKPYRAHSTLENFWMRSAMDMNLKSTILPKHLYEDVLHLRLRSPDGEVYEVSAPYMPVETVAFRGVGEATYAGFDKVLDSVSFDVWRNSVDRVLLISMYGFRDDLVAAADELIAYARSENILDYDLILDGTRSRGGGRGAYLVQRLSPRPFKTTFGNLRLSEVTPLFAADRRAQFERGEEFSDGSPETVGDPRWVIDWLEDDVAKGQAAGQDYSNNVPFKSAHAPKWSDGILRPAAEHFTGHMVCWYGPYGGSHLDQFAAITFDNDLCVSLGMPTGGFSNTWEWDETLRIPSSGRPVANFMWNIGHTIRPNGEILEGNPPDVTEHIPLTAENHETYYDMLMARSLEVLRQATRYRAATSGN